MKILLRYASNGFVGFTLQLKMAELEVLNNKFWNFWFLGHMTLMVTWPWKHKFAVISENVRDRAKRSEIWTLSGLLHAKCYCDFKVTWPSTSHDLEKVNLLLSHKSLEIERNGANFGLFQGYCMQNYKFWNLRFAVFWLFNINLPLSQKPLEIEWDGANFGSLQGYCI